MALPEFHITNVPPGETAVPGVGGGLSGNWCYITTDDSVPGISALQQRNFLPFLVCFAQQVVLDYTWIYTNFNTVINILYAVLIIGVVFLGMGRLLGYAPRIGVELNLIASTRGGRVRDYFNSSSRP